MTGVQTCALPIFTPLVDNLKILGIFKDKDKEEGNGVTDSLNIILRLLREELKAASWLIEVRSRIELIEPYNKEWKLRLYNG